MLWLSTWWIRGIHAQRWDKDTPERRVNEEAGTADVDGQPRHLHLTWPDWNLFELTPHGWGLRDLPGSRRVGDTKAQILS